MLSIISTVGTTVFGGFNSPLNKAVKEFEALRPKDIEKITYANTFPGEDIYRQALADLQAKTGNFLREACAEINAIEGFHEKHQSAQGNRYYFFASQTATGMLAARVLADFCRERYQASDSKASVVQGLQVEDPRKFRLEGLPFLIREIYDRIENAKRDRFTPIINTTGGFKAAIPYLTIIGMIQKVEVGLIHETSKELITLAGIPITFDTAAIEKIKPLLEDCDKAQENGISRSELAQGLGLSRNELIEDHPLWSLFEHYENDHYILSGLGTIALKELRARARQNHVWLSERAWERFNESDKNLKDQLSRIFKQMSNPDWTEQNLHATGNDKLKILKPSGAERILFYNIYKGVVVADIGLKNDGSYDKISEKLNELKRADYPPFYFWDIQ